MEFRRLNSSKKVFQKGVSLRHTLPETFKPYDMEAVFGPPDRDAFHDPTSGYDGNEWAFEADDGRVFNVYDRWGTMRVGATDYCLDFVFWLKERCPAARAV